MAENTSNGVLHDLQMASRKSEELALRRYRAVHWLECFVGPVGIPSQPSEKQFISCLRNGLILCKVINRIQPGSVPKVVENHLPVQSESVVWDAQPLPAYQYFENVRNFLVAVRELKLPAFEASDLEREDFEAGSAARIADCILALKSYHEWKEWSGGKGVYKHVTAKSPLVMHSAAKNFSRPLGTTTAQPCRSLDMSAVDQTQSLTDSIVKALTEHMVDSKENINDNVHASFGNKNQDPVQIFSEILSRCLEEKLRIKIPAVKSCLENISREANNSHTQAASILKENTYIQNNSEPCLAQSRKGSGRHWRLLQSQERDLSDIRVLWSQTKREFEDLNSQLFNDLKHLESVVEEMSAPAQRYQKVVQENRKLYNMVQDLKGNIRVYCLVRPILRAKATNVIDVVGEDGTVAVVDSSKPKNDGRRLFQFNRMYGPTATQELFKDAQPLIRSVMDGHNVCIIAYGQTGSGKTHTMYGPSGASIKETGVSFSALNDLFQMGYSRREIITYEVTIQMVELCNEEIRDVLAEDSALSHGELGSQDITLHIVKSKADAVNLVKRGLTAMNKQSPHSHSVVIVHVHGKEASGNILHGRLHLVDLAGSRELHNCEGSKHGMQESQPIDKSLSCLENVITSLSQKNPNISYRNSKLTSLLQHALGGHSKILMLAHVSPEGDDITETVSTLKFAQRVSTVELGAAHSNKMNTEVTDLKREIEVLKSALLEKDPQSQASNRELRSPIEKARVTSERTPPRSRRLSMEPKSPLEKPKVMTASTPQKSLRKSIEMPSAKKVAAKPREPRSPEMPSAKKVAAKPREPRSPGSKPRRLSIENPMIIRSERAQRLKEPKSPNGNPPRSRRLSIENSNSITSGVDNRSGSRTTPLSVKQGTADQSSVGVRRLSLEGQKEAPKSPLASSGHLSKPTFTDCAAKFPSLQPPRTPEHQKLDSQTSDITKSTNGKGSQIRKSLRTIGKLINGSEKRNQQKIKEVAATEVKSPLTCKARALRRRSLNGIPPLSSDRRSSLGGMSTDSRASSNDNRNAKTPPSVRSSTKITKRWV